MISDLFQENLSFNSLISNSLILHLFQKVLNNINFTNDILFLRIIIIFYIMSEDLIQVIQLLTIFVGLYGIIFLLLMTTDNNKLKKE